MSYYPDLKYFIRPNESEYIFIYSRSALLMEEGSYLIRVDSKKDMMISHKKLFDSNLLSFINLSNNINIYFFSNYLIVEKNGKNNTLKFASIFGHKFSAQVHSRNTILFGTYLETWKYRIQLILLKEPYIDFYKALIIEESAQSNSFKLIGLKDYYIFIRIDRNYFQENISYNYTYKILDLNLNLLNTVSVTYDNYDEIIFSDLSENNDVNEFLICIEYSNITTECQIIKCENSILSFSEKYEIFSQKEKFDRFHFYYLTINVLDKNKIGCYLCSVHSKSEYDFVTILQYENKKLFYYKDIKEIKIPTLFGLTTNHRQTMVMTEKGIAILSSSSNIYLSYINSICLSKNITLYTNSLLEFPINEFIKNGIEQLEFSFVEIYQYLTIYKNSIEVKTGEVFHDLNNFTYFLKIETYFKDFFLIKIKNHVLDNICEINVDINIPTNISTYKESHKCFKNDNYNTINNIIYSNLYNYFTVDNEDFIQFEFIMEYEPKDDELIIFYEDHSFACFYYHNKTICKVPLLFLPRLKIIYLYSYLSCYNLIDVGWFEINDKNIFNIYSLINYNFDYISEIYEPSQKITEYNPAMINYYYWFSCLSYCDDEKIDRRNCCNNILNKWEIIFHKEYNYDKNLLDLFVDIILKIVQISKGQGDPYDVVGDLDPKEYIDDLYEQYSNNKENIISILKKSKVYLSATFIGPYLEQLINAVYQYNFVILKNDEYKKIVVAFPGLTFYFQILNELINQGMVDLLDIPPKAKKNILVF